MNRGLAATLVLGAALAAGEARAIGTRVLGGDVITLAGTARGDAAPHRYSAREIVDARHLAELGMVGAQFNLGVMYTVNGRYRAALHWFHKAALRGHREASYNLGVLELDGKDGEADPTRAARWLTQAADRGMPEANYVLGRMYYEGRGVPRDLAQEREHYRVAAVAGHRLAQHDLGVILHLGEGTARDEVEAFAWFSVAQANGVDCGAALAEVRARLAPEQLATAAERASHYIESYRPH